LAFGLGVLIVKSSDGLLNLAFPDQERFDAAVYLVNGLLEFSLDGGSRLLDGLHVVILVLAWIAADLPWMMH